jgi:hypothetical protein
MCDIFIGIQPFLFEGSKFARVSETVESLALMRVLTFL